MFHSYQIREWRNEPDINDLNMDNNIYARIREEKRELVNFYHFGATIRINRNIFTVLSYFIWCYWLWLLCVGAVRLSLKASHEKKKYHFYGANVMLLLKIKFTPHIARLCVEDLVGCLAEMDIDAAIEVRTHRMVIILWQRSNCGAAHTTTDGRFKRNICEMDRILLAIFRN